MTVAMPKLSCVDRVLGFFGKCRAVRFPDAERKYGPYVYAMACKEPLIRTLLRSRTSPLPPGWVYLADFETIDEGESKKVRTR